MKFIKNKCEVSPEFVCTCAKKFNISPLIMEQIINRGNDDIEKITEFLNPTSRSFHNPFLLSGMSEFVERIKKVKKSNERVLIFGDYDMDGVSATAIMIKTLKILGINANYYLPNRFVDGYGLTNSVLDKIKKEYNPQLIITVDCGISCYEEVEYARDKYGIEVIITDHHEIPDILPKTLCLNAKLPNQKYGFNGLCGTGLAFKISEALIGNQAKEKFLAIACIATIADIVPLVDENRAIVFKGLKMLNKLPIGLKLLIKKLGININKCTSSEISFKLAPKINASGRMGDAQDSLKLYLNDNVMECKSLIDKILHHNNNRRDLCTVVENDCNEVLNKINMYSPSIIMASKNWDQGILGIICAKLVSQYSRPVFLFTEIDGEMKGSARSLDGINIHNLLSSMKDILETYGGHPLAAGLTLKSENFNDFIKRVNNYLWENYDSDIFVPKQDYDIEIKVEDLTEKFIKDIKTLEPCGNENEALKFYIKTKNFSFAPMKKYYNHCNIKLENKLNLVNFNCLEEYGKLKLADEVQIVFELQQDGYGNTLKGIVKALDCEFNSLKHFDNMQIIPQIEQLKYLNTPSYAKYTLYNSLNNFNVKNNFGTAFVINSAKGYEKFKKIPFNKSVNKIDVESGIGSTGINTMFIYPQNIEFARSYKRIIFFDPIIDLSYLAKINQISNAELFIPNEKPDKNFFNQLNLSRENFAKIYTSLIKIKNNFVSLFSLYSDLKKSQKIDFSYKEFYCAVLVFNELKILKLQILENKMSFKINKKIKTELNKSNVYKTIQNYKNYSKNK